MFYLINIVIKDFFLIKNSISLSCKRYLQTLLIAQTNIFTHFILTICKVLKFIQTKDNKNTKPKFLFVFANFRQLTSFKWQCDCSKLTLQKHFF